MIFIEFRRWSLTSKIEFCREFMDHKIKTQTIQVIKLIASDNAKNGSCSTKQYMKFSITGLQILY